MSDNNFCISFDIGDSLVTIISDSLFFNSEKLNWKTKWNFEQSIQKVVEFEKMLKNKINCYDICVKQVKEYLN